MNLQITSHIDQISININTLTLTANQRIALRLQESYDQQQIDKGLISWETPPIIPLTTWLNSLAQKIIRKQILSTPQENYLWEQIIRKTCNEHEILNPADTAAIAASAWKTLHLWDTSFIELEQESNEEVALFYQWALQFKSQCKQHNWISGSEIHKEIIQQLPKLSYEKIQLIGFDDFPPIIDALLKQIEQTTPLIQLRIEQEPFLEKISFHDQMSEIKAMAYWSKEQLHNNPQTKIGCIIPELNTLRRTLFNTFTQILDPKQLLPGYALNKSLFNISAGQQLSEYPIINTALTVIHWLTNHIESTQFGNTLQSPYIHKSPIERDYAAQLDRHFRELNDAEHFSDLFRIDQNRLLTPAPNLLKRLYEFNTCIQSASSEATLLEWKNIFSELLTIIGWPGYRVLNSEEYQLYTRWQLLLDEFTQYDTVTTVTIALSEALYLLRKIATSTLFQTEGSLAPIQILGTLEAAGNTFDHLWIMGMDDETWPPIANPNPFIPYEIQRKKNMPHATAERELIYTQSVMHRLCNSATHIIFSYPLFEGDTVKNPSQLLNDIESTTLSINDPPSETIIPAVLETIRDSQGPIITSDEMLRLSSTTLQQQSDCPFKAFANTRLHAKPLNTPTFGLPDNQRGLLTHDVLDRIWQHLKSQKQLNSLSHSELTHLIMTIVDAVIADQHTHTTFKKELLLLERNRLLSLMEEWLSYEKKRAAFVVSGTEVSLQLPLNNVIFNVRIDRIDQLDTGKCIIDYKTHTHSHISAWFGERPSDPQLPLYLVINSDYTAITYADVVPNKCQFKGLANNATTAKQLPDIKDIDSFSKNTLTWDEQLALWQKTITRIAKEFEQGLASVTPQDPNKSCTYCELQPLCKVEMP